MLFSIVVPTCNRYPALSRCLAALQPQLEKLGPETCEIIVTDDSPDDASKSKIATDFPGVRWQQGPRRGPAANRNSGAKGSQGDWLVFVDDDCIPRANLLSAYREAMAQNPRVLVFEGAIVEECPRTRLDEEAPLNKNGGYLWSCNFMIQRELFFALDGFCELFPYAALEDVDLRERLKKKGLPFLFVSEASVIHPWRIFRPARQQIKIQTLSHQLFYARHPDQRETIPQVLQSGARSLFRGLFMDGPRLHFRGATNWFTATLTSIYLGLSFCFKNDSSSFDATGPLL